VPNRIIKESICTSENLNNVSSEAEVLFYRIMVNCDDYGRLDARFSVLRAKCFPLKIDELTDAHISKWLKELSDCALIDIYSVGGQNYLALKTWSSHQQIRAKKSKYPDPNGSKPVSLENNCKQLIADDNNCPRNPIQSNPIRNPIRKRRARAREESTSSLEDYINKELRVDYPDIDIDNELKKFKLYWSEGSRKLQRPKTAFRNWMDKTREFKKEQGNGAYQGSSKRRGTRLPDRNTGYTEPPYDPELAAEVEAFERSGSFTECQP